MYNEAQSEAIAHRDGPALVLAGPGSGKTLVITHRTRKLIEDYQIPPENILVITFTKAASIEMKQRFDKLMENRRCNVSFGTFHSIFFKILKHAYNYNASNIIREDQRKLLVRQIINSMQLDLEDTAEFVDGILSEIGMIKNDRIALEHYYAKNCSEETFRDIYTQYQKKMCEQNMIDFDDMLLMTYELLSARKDILNQWRRKYQYILIDEFQDINQVQYDIIKMIAAPANNLFIVGDDDQSIYRFRGSKPEIMLNFEKEYKNTHRILLNINYRSTKNIVRAATNIIRHNKQRFPKEILTVNHKGEKIVITKSKSPAEEAKSVINKINKYISEGIDDTDIAVLFRTNIVARELVGKLIEYNIPFQMRDVLPNIFEHWIAKDIIHYIKMIRGNRERATFLAIMNRPNRYLSRECLTEDYITFDMLRKYYFDKKWMIERIDKWENDLKWMARLSPYAMIQYLRKGVNFDEYIVKYAEYRRMNPEDLNEVLDALQESAKPYKTFEEWFDYIEEYTRQLKEQWQKRQENREGISLVTMHSSKGLEYKIVFVISADEGITPHSKAVLDEDIEEERRLFYVAVTRAKEKLHVCYVEERYNKPMEISRFLQEMIG